MSERNAAPSPAREEKPAILLTPARVAERMGMSEPGSHEPHPNLLTRFGQEVARKLRFRPQEYDEFGQPKNHFMILLESLRQALVKPPTSLELRVTARTRFRRAWRLFFASLPALSAVTVDFFRTLIGRPSARLLSRGREDILARLNVVARDPTTTREDRKLIISYIAGGAGADTIEHLLDPKALRRFPKALGPFRLASFFKRQDK